MRLYKTKQFVSKSGLKKDIINVVFNDVERDTFKDIQEKLVQIFKMKKQQGTLSSWNEYDREALYEILVWPMHYKDSGKMQDLTQGQINKICLMLNKLFDDSEVDFYGMFDLKFEVGFDEETFMTEREMRKEMDRRRAILNPPKQTFNVSMNTFFDCSKL